MHDPNGQPIWSIISDLIIRHLIPNFMLSRGAHLMHGMIVSRQLVHICILLINLAMHGWSEARMWHKQCKWCTNLSRHLRLKKKPWNLLFPEKRGLLIFQLQVTLITQTRSCKQETDELSTFVLSENQKQTNKCSIVSNFL